MNGDLKSNYTDEELEELEDELLEEDFHDREEKMPVDGRSVFEIERLKHSKEKEREQSRE